MDTQAIVKVNSKVPPLVKLVAVASHKTLGSAETQSRLLSAAAAPSGSTVAMLTWTPGAGEDTCGVDLQLRPVDALAAGGALGLLFCGQGAGLCVHVKTNEGKIEACAKELAATDLAGVYRKLTRE